MAYTTLLFDLDDTIYPGENGLWDAIGDRMSLYMYERLGLSWEEIPELRLNYYQTYGTTMRGLQMHYDINPEDYLAFVHDLPLETYLEPSSELKAMLLSLPQRRWIFTNADADHAANVLETLNLRDCFEGIIDVRAMAFACKPEAEAYSRALNIAGEQDPGRCVILDDARANLESAHKFGMTTVLVGKTSNNNPAINYSVAELIDLPNIVPQLWEREGVT